MKYSIEKSINDPEKCSGEKKAPPLEIEMFGGGIIFIAKMKMKKIEKKSEIEIEIIYPLRNQK